MNLPNDNGGESVRYLTALELYTINQEITSGDGHVRDVHLLKSAAIRPAICIFGQFQFPTVIDKAAALLESLAYHHLFSDGNKRTAVRAVQQFLEMNGCRVDWGFEEEYPFVLEIAQGRHDVEQIALWLTNYVRPTVQDLGK